MNKLLLLGEIMTTIKAFPVGQQHTYPTVFTPEYLTLHRGNAQSNLWVYLKHITNIKSLRSVRKNGNSCKLLRDFILKRPITLRLSWKSGLVN